MSATTTLTPEQRAAFLRWPDRRNCEWECPWPAYCIECHTVAWHAMVDAQRRLVSLLTGVPLADIPEVR